MPISESVADGSTTVDEEAEAEKKEAALLMMAMPKKYHMVHCLAYGYIGGIFGSCSVLFGKTVGNPLCMHLFLVICSLGG